MLAMSQTISFSVNGTPIQVPGTLGPDTSLVTFLRNHLGLKGTKYMCKEGACGSCIVTLSRVDPVTGESINTAINSCLTPVLACHGGAITTIEGVGNKAKGYSRVQATLAKCSGTQCGFCSPGMVMNMYSLMANNDKVTMNDVENSFGGNFCRCTGYRPILDSFKILSCDASDEMKHKIIDIEDIWKIVENSCHLAPSLLAGLNTAQSKDSQPAWCIPEKLEQLAELLKDRTHNEYVLVAGNTSQGVYKRAFNPLLFINMNYIKALKQYTITDTHIELGGNMTLSELMVLFYRLSGQKKFQFLAVLADHIQLVANVPVRNVGTLAGNLIIKHEHPEFPSDLFVILETVNAKIVTVTGLKEDKPLTFPEFLQKRRDKLIITKIIIPLLSDDYKLKTFKIMARAQNVYAHVNAGFLFRLDPYNNIIEKPNIVYGGINSKFVHATNTEEFFYGKNIFDKEDFKSGLKVLSSEIRPVQEGFQASNEYRKALAINLYYKYVLSLIAKANVPQHYKSGGSSLYRPLSRGKQSFQTKKDIWPLTKPLNKVEGIIQCSGEAEYVNDIPESKDQLHGALVLAEKAGTLISEIDPQAALDMNGTVAFFSAKDIPGKNVSFINKGWLVPDNEELFCSGKVVYGGQPVGIIVATSEAVAQEAAKRVKIMYKPGDPPVLTVKDVLKQNLTSRITQFVTNKPKEQDKNGHCKNELSGELELRPQFHFTMEPQSCVCIPMEDGLNLYSATQWMSETQAAVAVALNIPVNSINMEVRRIGGGFGCKITRSSMVATACALAAFKLNKAVRLILDIETNMKAVGKRNAAYSKYEVGFDDSGLIGSLKVWLYDDMGCNENDPCTLLVEPGIKNCYSTSKWEISIYSVITDTPSSSWMRAPGTIEGITTVEEIMEHIAFTLKKDPLEVRLRNFGQDFPLLRTMISTSVEDSQYYKRKQEIQLFNEANRWRKRGISFLPMAFYLDYFIALNCMISVYASDGTVAITHGGIEMGQGINTKTIQMCAASLGIDTSKIKVKPSSLLTSPNALFSGASITSHCVIYSTLKCCEILNERLKGIKEKMKGASWEEIIKAAENEEVNLNVSFINRASDGELKGYYVYGTCVTEVEVDVLTGQYQILRTDILEDAGESLNPELDIGQVEGAFVMGLGYYLTEDIQLDPLTGLTITNSTSSYIIPGAKDIPIDFRVSLLKNAPNPYGVARSKATGEPPICLALSASFALRNAVNSARQDTGLKEWLPFSKPFSVEKVCLASNTATEHIQI